MSSPVAENGSASLSGTYAGHEECRLREFVRWPRIVLEHEREYLSRTMSGKAFLAPDEVTSIMHDLADIDGALSQLPKRIETPDAS